MVPHLKIILFPKRSESNDNEIDNKNWRKSKTKAKKTRSNIWIKREKKSKPVFTLPYICLSRL